jgi:rod shape-determining protein MreC
MRFIYSKSFAVFAGGLLLVALFILLQVKGFLNPVKNLALQAPRPVIFIAQSVTRPVKRFFNTVYKLKDITSDNAELTGEVHELRQELAKYEQVNRENEALRKELGFQRNSVLNLSPCSVLAQNPLNLTDTVVLDCGSDKGVEEGQAVISGGYLAGKIIYSKDGSSTALLVTNSKFSADAQLTRTGSEAIVRGSFGSGIFMEQLSQNAQLEKGWLVVTAGINDKIPKNILIGQVGDTVSNNSDLFKKATIVTPVDFENLDFVFVAK